MVKTPVARDLSAPPSAPSVRSRLDRNIVGLFLGPLLFVSVLVAPLALTREQQALAAVLIFAVTYWITEALPIPVTSLLALGMCVLLDVPPEPGQPARLVFSEFASPLLFLLIGGFIIAQAMVKYGLSRRVALRVLALPGVAASTHRIVITFGAMGTLLASVVDNGAVAAMMLPIALGLIKALSPLIQRKDPVETAKARIGFGTAILLLTAYGPTMGALLTPFGDASNLIGRRFIADELGIRISLGQWVLMAAPIVLVLFALLCVVVLARNMGETRRIPGARRYVREESAKLGHMTRGEINTLIAFATAIFLWLLPTIVGLVAGRLTPLHTLAIDRLPPEVAAILAATLLFVLPVSWRERTFTMTWADAAKIEWGTLMLLGSGVTLGKLMGSTGLANVLGDMLVSPNLSPVIVYLLAATACIALSELTSNLASIGIILPIVPAMAAISGADLLVTVLIVTFATKYGFMLPISTSANAIVYGSGKVPITKMVGTGLIVDLSAIVVIAIGVNLMWGIVGLG